MIQQKLYNRACQSLRKHIEAERRNGISTADIVYTVLKAADDICDEVGLKMSQEAQIAYCKAAMQKNETEVGA